MPSPDAAAARSRRHPHRREWLWGALIGIVSAAVLLAVSEVFAAVLARGASPLLAVGSFVIDIVPRPLKELAITTFGSADKIALLAGLGLGAVIAAIVAGVLQARKPPFGAVLLGIGGALAFAAVLTRAGSGALSWAPPVLGTIAGVAALIILTRMLQRWLDPEASTRSAKSVEAERPHTLDRRLLPRRYGADGARRRPRDVEPEDRRHGRQGRRVDLRRPARDGAR